MKIIAASLFASLLLGTLAIAEVPRSIFDDDWQPAPAAQPASPGVGENTPPPRPSETPAVTQPSTQSSQPPVRRAAVARIAVPSAGAQADAWKLIKGDLYKDDIANARTAAQKVMLAQKLLSVAAETTNDAVGKYVLLAQAKELAIGSGDPATAFACLNETGKFFEIDYPLQKVDLFAALARTVATPSDGQTLAEGLNQWADAQVKLDRYDAARKACDIALAAARKVGPSALVNQTLLHLKQIGEIESAYQSVRPAATTLASKPADPAANLALGKFYCFLKGDWERGVPLLALGSDVELKGLAQKEASVVSGSDAKVALADAWWDLSENQKAAAHSDAALTKTHIQEHAVTLYEQALPRLDGLVKAKAIKRIQSVQPSGPRVVDLLKLVDLQRDAISGHWEAQNGGLISDGAREGTRLEFLYQPPAEYDYKVVFTRIGGDCDVGMTCLLSGRQFEFQVGGWHNTVIGFGLVGHHQANKNPTTRFGQAWVTNGQKYTSLVKVRRNSVQGYLNGELVTEWKTDFSDLGPDRHWVLRRDDIIGLGSWESPTIFESAEVTEITGSGRRL